MISESTKKIIHCVCPLSTDGVPTPFIPYTANHTLPPSPPTTPNHLLPKSQTVPLHIYYPNKDFFNVHSRPSWYMIHGTSSLSLAGYSQSICIDSRPSKHAFADRELHSFIVNVLDPLFKASPGKPCSLSPSISNISQSTARNMDKKSMWNNFASINSAYAEAVAQRYNPGDIVWIHDYQLLLLPHYLRQLIPNVKVGLSIYANFPYWEHLSSIYGNKFMLESMLQADHLGFQTKIDARHFATACTRFLALNTPPSSKKIGVFPSGVSSQLLLKSSVIERAKAIREMFPQKQIIFCRDTHVANVVRTLAAFSQLFSKDRFLMDHLVLIHVCSTNVPSSDLKMVPEIVRQINQLYGSTECVPVHFYHQDIDREEQEALMAAADLGLFLGSHPSTLIAAKEFVVCQSMRHAPLIVSQDSCLVIPNSAITTIEDPSNIPALVTALHDSLTMCSIDSEKRYETLYNLVMQNDASTCAHRFIEALLEHETLPLYTQKLRKCYKTETGKKLIIVCDDNEVIASPSDKTALSGSSLSTQTPLLSRIESLSKASPNTTVCLVSGQREQELNKWLASDISSTKQSYGLSAEYGAFIKLPSETTWQPTSTTRLKSTQWKEPILDLFHKYKQKLIGACILECKTMLTLDFSKCYDTEKASIASKTCYEEISKIIRAASSQGQRLKVFSSKSRLQVQKCSSLYSLEGYSFLIETLLETVQPDLIICIGSKDKLSGTIDDQPMVACEEAMFSTLYSHELDREHLFAISRRPKKCTMANWYLRENLSLDQLLKIMA